MNGINEGAMTNRTHKVGVIFGDEIEAAEVDQLVAFAAFLHR
jgi:hypothetical protein